MGVVVKYLTTVYATGTGSLELWKDSPKDTFSHTAPGARKVIEIREYEFKVVKKTTTTVEEGESFSIVLKPNNRLTACKLELKITTENVFIAQDELGFGLDMGDTVCFEKVKTGKQLKITATAEDIKKTTPDMIKKKKGRPRKLINDGK